MFVKSIHKPSSSALAIYTSNMMGARLNAMLEMYPICQELLGSNVFINLCRHYIQQSTQEIPDLNVFGEGFSCFISTTSIPVDCPVLMDIANLEFLKHRAYWANQRKPFDTGSFSKLSLQEQSQHKLCLSSDLGLLNSKFDLKNIYYLNDKWLPSALESGSSYKYFLIERRSRVPCIVQIESLEYHFLKLLDGGITLRDLCETEALDISPLGEQILKGRIESKDS